MEFHLQCSFDCGGVKGGGGCLTLAFLSRGLMVNFLSVKEMFLISLQGKPIFGVILGEVRNKNEEKEAVCKLVACTVQAKRFANTTLIYIYIYMYVWGM